MLNTQAVKSLTDLRSDPSGVIKLAKDLLEPVYIFSRSKPVSIIMAIEEYEDLIDRLDDATDALEMQKFEKSPKNPKDWVSHEEIKKKYKIG